MDQYIVTNYSAMSHCPRSCRIPGGRDSLPPKTVTLPGRPALAERPARWMKSNVSRGVSKMNTCRTSGAKSNPLERSDVVTRTRGVLASIRLADLWPPTGSRKLSNSPFEPRLLLSLFEVTARQGRDRSSRTLLNMRTLPSVLQKMIILALRSAQGSPLRPASTLEARSLASSANTLLTSCATSARRLPEPEKGTNFARSFVGRRWREGDRMMVMFGMFSSSQVIKDGGRVAVDSMIRGGEEQLAFRAPLMKSMIVFVSSTKLRPAVRIVGIDTHPVGRQLHPRRCIR